MGGGAGKTQNPDTFHIASVKGAKAVPHPDSYAELREQGNDTPTYYELDAKDAKIFHSRISLMS
jgi:hypothetical protein